jgi:hypothetical protein
MHATSKLWHVSDPKLPVDLASQVVYADRFRIRKPGDTAFTLSPHLDSSAIERWEDPTYRSNYAAIFAGNWEAYDPWRIDTRLYAKTDLYHQRSSCSAFRAMQGWLSLCECGPGEGTLRLLPSVKLSTAYIMLRPFFVDGERFDTSQPTFPGATPGQGQFFPTSKWHPHLQLERMVVSVPKVRPGDYVFWHADLVHDVERRHGGLEDSSVSLLFQCSRTVRCRIQGDIVWGAMPLFSWLARVGDFYKTFYISTFSACLPSMLRSPPNRDAPLMGNELQVIYNANIPLCPYNIENMMTMRKAFRDVVPPPDFYLDCGGPYEMEKQHEDHGAREENILTLEGRRALGLADFDVNEPGLTEGQRAVRRMANEAMRSAN